MVSVFTYLKNVFILLYLPEFHCYIIQEKCLFSHYHLKIHPYCLLHPIVVIERSGVSLFVGYLHCGDLSFLLLLRPFILEFCIFIVYLHNYRFFSVYPDWYILSLLCFISSFHLSALENCPLVSIITWLDVLDFSMFSVLLTSMFFIAANFPLYIFFLSL